MIIAASFRKCKIDDCHGKAVCRDWCAMHYRRWQLHGDPLITKYARTRRGSKSIRDTAKENGLATYFTGIPCCNGHIADRLVRNYECIECARESSKSSERKQYIKRYHSQNKDEIREYKRAWYRGLPPEKKARHNALCAGYTARVKRATPKWADLEAIAKIYQQAKVLSMEVDHIVPLQGKNVCGLHAINNLQHLTMEDNRSKNNRFEDNV